MAYEMVMPYHLHMPSYFLETFTEYPYERDEKEKVGRYRDFPTLMKSLFRLTIVSALLENAKLMIFLFKS
jgi:hypothetical protein